MLVQLKPTFAQNQKVATTLQGLQYEGEVFDIPEYSAGQVTLNPFGSANPIAVIDDGLRRVIIGTRNLDRRFGDSQRNEIEFLIRQKVYNGSAGGALQLIRTGPFDQFGHREFIVQDLKQRRQRYVQGITKITPRYCVVNSLVGAANGRQWKMPLATNTIDKDVLHNLLLRQVDSNNVDDYFDIADFFQQAKDYQRAGDELLFIENKFPDQKQRIKEQRTRLAQLYGRQILDESKFRIRNGQPRLAALWAKVLDSPEFSLDIQAELEELKENATNSQKRLIGIRDQLIELAETADLSPESETVVERFLQEIQNELSDANASRLDAYLRVAQDKSLPAAQKMALAVSGWLLGSNSAIENMATVETLYNVKNLVFEYLADGTSDQRRRAILAELGSLETGVPSFIANLLNQSKPIAAEDLSQYTGRKPIEFFVELPGPPAKPSVRRYQCLAHLPTEYDPHRKYPLIVTLPGLGQPLEENLDIWCGAYNEALSNELQQPVRNGQASRQGFIVLAVDWRRSKRASAYRYSVREHRIVLEGLYQAMRRFSVDSDRVFLSGHGEGGTAAYDIGVSHPEHWAGVLGFSGLFQKYVNNYNSNRHVGLPMYVVVGEKHLAASRSLETSANKWLKSSRNRFINLTLIQYKGQLNRYFQEEIPEAFKWINAQVRQWPDGEGFSFDCKSLREGDTYFWFLEMDNLPPQMSYVPELYEQTKFEATLKLKGEIKRPNLFYIEPRNTRLGKTTLWLSPDFVDLSKTIEIRGRGDFKGEVVPSTKTLLDDVLRRSDTQHPYWAKLRIVDGDWTQVE